MFGSFILMGLQVTLSGWNIPESLHSKQTHFPQNPEPTRTSGKGLFIDY
jgi:hypothetical protein